MPGPEVPTFRKTLVKTLMPGNRFRHDGRWYELQPVSPGDSRMIAMLLEPDMFYGSKPSGTGHIMGDNIEVEMPVDYYSEFGKEMDDHPIATLRVSRGTAVDVDPDANYWSDGCEVPNP